jgi:transcriptional regulator with XRE-family HTH domain
MKDFKERLKSAIQEKNITASELSRISGVGKADISNYMNGKYLPKQDKVFMLAKALGVDPGWLMTGVEQKAEDEEPIAVFIPNSEAFFKVVKYMHPEDYEAVMKAFERTYNRMKEDGIEI